jgi:shikimate 5-dehydrogenase
MLGAIKDSSPFPHFLAMLVYQGAASFELWTGKEAPVDIMLKRAREMLMGGVR